MRRLSYLLVQLLALLSCTREPLSQTETGGPYISLELRCNDPVEVLSKAGADGTQEGLDRYNENLISTVDFFFWPGNETSSDAVYHVHLTSGNRRSDVFRLEMTSEEVNNKIFPLYPSDIREATVLAIVNYPGTMVADEEDLSGTSLDEINAIALSTDFVSPADHKQPSFIMSGSQVIELRGRTQIMAATGTIALERYACKMTVGLNVATSVELSSGEVWSPMLEGMEVYLVNGVQSVTLGGEDPTPEYFSYSTNRMRFVRKDVEGNLIPLLDKTGNYFNTYPMYMYPQHWTYGSNGDTDKEPYLKLVVPWRRSGEHGFSPTQKQFYYKIIMPDDKRSDFKRRFARNNWYHINIDVGILGAETDEAAVTVDAGLCYMVYWQDLNVVIKEAEIGNARYLSVDHDSCELHNVPSVNIRYTTSHPVIIKEGSISVTRPYYGESSPGTNTLGGTVRKAGLGNYYPVNTLYLEYSEAQRKAMSADGKDWISNTGTSIFYNHPINNDYTQALFDYSPYHVTFSLVHEDSPTDERFEKTIDIVQNPAIYISAEQNSDNTVVKVGDKLYDSQYWGYVYIDNEQLVRQGPQGLDYWKDLADSLGYSLDEYHWRTVWYTGGSRDLFNITVSVLPSNSDFIIGDPRELEVDNLRDDYHEADALFGDSPRRLQWYYPAENSDRTYNMLAPSYRIASKHGGVEFDPISIEQARQRCAAYQEDGYPAGRWRLPTRGEIRFIAMLSANKAFTFLFSNNGTYWSANGAIQVQNSTVVDSPSTTALGRCLYDSWYWDPFDDRQENREHFAWGDRPR